MRKHPVRKFLGLTVLYSAIIVGIFVLQFKSNSVISKSFGDLKFTLTGIQAEDGTEALKNQLYVSFKGLVFSADEKNPVLARNSDGSESPLVLEAYEESENSVQFLFSKGGSIKFEQIPDEADSTGLFISAVLPENSGGLLLPYAIPQSYSIESSSPSSMILSSKAGTFSFTSADFSNSQILFAKSSLTAKYSQYVPAEQFAFAQIAGLPGTKDSEIRELFIRLRYRLVEKVREAFVSSEANSLSEGDITAYVAELASQGRYNQAIDSVPDSFKKGGKRTYISAPFFDSLAVMNRSLSVQTEKYASLVESKSLDAFTSEGIADYILREKKSSAVKSLLSSVSAVQPFSPTPFQAGCIISVYCGLYSHDKALSESLKPVLEQCVSAIQEKCVLENEFLSIAESEGELLDTYRAVTVGNALVSLAKIRNDTVLLQAGNLLMFSALSQQELALRTISSIYPVLAKDNFFFPHTEILGYYGNSCVWAWTCAKSITYTFSPEMTANIFIDFPLSLTHYVIFKGVPNFNGKIEIQSQMFRTDPNFEMYNSSGYVYQSSTRSLFIKSRHKSKMELIRLFFSSRTQFETAADPSKVPELPKPAEKAEAQKPAPVPEPASPAQPPESKEETAENVSSSTEENQ